MMSKSDRLIRSESEWRGHIGACEASGMSGAAYTRVHGINAKSFHNARRRLGRTVGNEPPSRGAVFKRVEVIGERESVFEYRIRFRSGVVVEVGGGGDLDRLGGVLRALGDYL